MKEFSKPYLLYVGNDYPHKNLKRLKSAFEKLIGDGLNYELVLAGANDFISDAELENLYGNAGLFVFPSLVEGFGLPPLEAMVRGVAVVCSDIPALVEILADAAIYFNPLDIDDMAEKIKKVLLDKDLKDRLINRGYAQAKKYNWQETAEETLKIYESIPLS